MFWDKDWQDEDDNPEEWNAREDESKNYEGIEESIDSADEDAGVEREVIIKDRRNGKFYRLSYNDWEIEYNWGDFTPELVEVFPEVIEKVIYK